MKKKYIIIIFFYFYSIIVVSCNKHLSPTPISSRIISTVTPYYSYTFTITPTKTDIISLTPSITSSLTHDLTISPTITNTFTNTHTPTLTKTIPIIYLTATIQCTCFEVNTCGSGPSYSSPGPITVDNIGRVWVSEGTTCAYLKSYNPITGEEISSQFAYLVYGLEYSALSNSCVSTWIKDYLYVQEFPTFSKSLSQDYPLDHYRGLAYDGNNWWTVYAKGWAGYYIETKLQKFSSTGELLASYDAPYLANPEGSVLNFPGSCWDISYSSFTNSIWAINKNRIYVISCITGELYLIYDLGDWYFNGIHFDELSHSFWATYQPKTYSYKAKICHCFF